MESLQSVDEPRAAAEKADKLSQRSLPKLISFSVAVGLVVYVGFAVYTDAGKVRDDLAHYAVWTALVSLALAFCNYLLRFARWQIYLRTLKVAIPRKESAAIFLSGFALTVTPGKLGEVVKSVYLRQRHGIPLARTAPTVIAERLTDLIAAVLLGIGGATALGVGLKLVAIAAAMCLGLLVVIASRRLSTFLISLIGRLPPGRRLAPKLLEFYDSTAVLLAPVPLFWGTLLSTLAWACECLGFYVVVGGFAGAKASLFLCFFIYTFTTIAGALSFLPGGIGVQEGSMVALLVRQGAGISRSMGLAATFITRLTTLWFAVLLGVFGLLYLQKVEPQRQAD